MCFPSEMFFFAEMGIVNTAPWGPLPQPAARTNLPDAGRVGKVFYHGSEGN